MDLKCSISILLFFVLFKKFSIKIIKLFKLFRKFGNLAKFKSQKIWLLKMYLNFRLIEVAKFKIKSLYEYFQCEIIVKFFADKYNFFFL